MDLRARNHTDWKKLHEGEPLSCDRSARFTNTVTLPGVYCVERLIQRKKTQKGVLYLVQWEGYSIEDCTWEPEHHLPSHLIQSYHQPDACPQLISAFFRDVERGFQARLKTREVRFSVPCPLDVFRSVYHSDGKVHLQQADFTKHFLSDHWWYHVNVHGEGTCVDFPVRAWPRVRMTSTWVVRDGRVLLVKTPVETVQFAVLTRACDAASISKGK